MNFKGLYFWFGLPVLVVVAWVLLVYIPMDSSAKSQERRLTDIKNEIQTIERDMKEFVGEATTQKRLRQSYDEFMGQAPVVEKMPEYMRNVMSMAKNR